jgi:hypothetical protein
VDQHLLNILILRFTELGVKTMPATYDKIEVITANGSASTYTFLSIPNTYTDLILVANTVNAQTGGFVALNFNSDTGGNYSRTFFYGDGTSTISGRGTNATRIDAGGTNPNGAFASYSIFNYSNTTTNKTVLAQHLEPSRLVAGVVAVWRNTAAITRIDVSTQSALSAGQVLTLYGIKAA